MSDAENKCQSGVKITKEVLVLCRKRGGHRGKHEFLGLSWGGQHYCITWDVKKAVGKETRE